MFNDFGKFLKTNLLCLSLWGMLLPVFNLCATEAVAANPAWAAYYSESGEGAPTSKPMLALEGRLKDPRLLDRLEKKLLSIPDEKRSLIYLLADRMDEERKGLGADIVFLLMTILIVLC